MRLQNQPRHSSRPISHRRAMDVIGGSALTPLKLHFDDSPENVFPFPGHTASDAPTLAPRHTLRLRPLHGRAHNDPIADAQYALDRMERQLGNLRDLLGDDLGLPDSPRAA